MGAAGFFEKPFDTNKLLAASLLRSNHRRRPRSNPLLTDNSLSMRQRILVLEDDRNITSALEVRLKAAGYDVWVARNAMVALELAAAISRFVVIGHPYARWLRLQYYRSFGGKLACRIYR